MLVGVLRGVFCFMADLMRHLSIPAEMDFMSISYYGEKSPAVKITKDLDLDISGLLDVAAQPLRRQLVRILEAHRDAAERVTPLHH